MRILAIILFIILIAISILICCGEYTYAVYEVIITEDLKFNHSVGNEWQIVYMCGDRTIESGEKWTVPIDSTEAIKIKISITEKDAQSDNSQGSLTVALRDDVKKSTTITVTENMGRFKGNTAQWEITCRVRLVNKLM